MQNGGTQTHFTNHKVLALLAYLACSGATHSRAELADLLWDDRSSARASANLHTLLTRARSEWGDWMDIGRETVGMAGKNDWCLTTMKPAKIIIAVREKAIKRFIICSFRSESW